MSGWPHPFWPRPGGTRPVRLRNKQIEALKQYASVLLPAPVLIALLMDLNVPKGGFRHVSKFMTRRVAAYTAATGLPFPHAIPSRDRFRDTWKELVKALALDRPVSWRIPPQAAALGCCNRGPATSNRVHPLWTPSIRRGHFRVPWGCLPVRRWKLDSTFLWAPQPRCTGPNTRLRIGDWYGRMRG